MPMRTSWDGILNNFPWVIWFITAREGMERERASCLAMHEDSCRVSAGVGHSCCAWSQGLWHCSAKGKLLGSISHLRRTQVDLGLHHSTDEKLDKKYRGSSILGCSCVNKLVSGSIPGHWRAVTCTTALAVHLSRASQQSPKGSPTTTH